MVTRFPDIYIIGTQKSGTTTLYDWMAQHPEIYAHPMAKDYPYFSDDRTFHDGPKLFCSLSMGASDNQSVLGGEANAIYASKAPWRMHEVIPSARLVVILRNPVDRAFSGYCYAVERLMEDRTLEAAFQDELNGMEYMPDDALQRDYLSHGQYAQQLQRIYQYFNTEQVKVIIFEEMIQQPQKILAEVFKFVGVSDYELLNRETKNETKGGYRSGFLAKVIHGRPSSKLIRNMGRVLIPYSLRTGLRRKLVEINRISRPKPKFTDDVKKLLVDYYKEEVDELERLLGREIQSWHKSQ